jgi:hypothetical protein
VHQFDLVRDIAPHFDLCVVPEQAARADFLSVGARPVRIQLAANPRVYHPLPEPRLYDVTFVGQRYADRAELLQHLYTNGVAVRAWGAGWQARKRLDVAGVKAGLALVEDERWDGVSRIARARLRGLSTAVMQCLGVSGRSADPVDTTPEGTPQGGLDQFPLVGNPRAAGDQSPPDRGIVQLEPPHGTTPENPGWDDASRHDPPYEPVANVPGDETPIDISAFGGPRLLQHDLVRMFSCSRLSLGFATAGESHRAARRLRHLRLREFEAPMSGALYLTEDQPELAEYFTPGQEMLTYTDRDDLLDKVRYYLAHQEQAERIRRAGLERARREHTWQHRFADLFSALGLPSTLNGK